MNRKFNWAGHKLPIVSLFVCLILALGCGSQPNHPNQFDVFDGGTYDTLTLAHGALDSLRPVVTTQYPKYAGLFNQAASAYMVAVNAYSVYRIDRSKQGDLSAAISNLTASVVALEAAFEADMHTSTAQVSRLHARAAKLRATAAFSLSDLLAELQIAATIARAVAPAEPYAALAQIVLLATSQALAEQHAAANQPIDLATLTPIAAIS